MLHLVLNPALHGAAPWWGTACVPPVLCSIWCPASLLWGVWAVRGSAWVLRSVCVRGDESGSHFLLWLCDLGSPRSPEAQGASQAAFCNVRLTKESFISEPSLAAGRLFPSTFLWPVLFLLAVPVNHASMCIFQNVLKTNTSMAAVIFLLIDSRFIKTHFSPMKLSH